MKIDELKKIAMAAKGPWWEAKELQPLSIKIFDVPFQEHDAEFIATFNPGMVMKLLKVVEEAQNYLEPMPIALAMSLPEEEVLALDKRLEDALAALEEKSNG